MKADVVNRHLDKISEPTSSINNIHSRVFAVIFVVVALGIMLSLTACATSTGTITGDRTSEGSDNANGSTGNLKVIASIFAPYDFARQIAGDSADVSMLVPPGSETHSFEPTPQDIIKLQECDIFIYVGGESDAWIDDMLSSIDTSDKHIIRLMDVVSTRDEVVAEGMQGEAPDNQGEQQGDDKGQENTSEVHQDEQDEHVWTSVPNAKLIVRAIADVMMVADTDHNAAYDSNTQAYLEQLDDLDARFREVVAQAQRTTVVFADRFPFLYFAEEYGLQYYAAFPGCSNQTEASANTIAYLIKKVRDESIPVVFTIELSSHRLADTIAEQTGAQVMLLHACHNISKDDFAAGATYLSLMSQNVENLKTALN